MSARKRSRALRLCLGLSWRADRSRLLDLTVVTIIEAAYLPLTAFWLRGLTNAVVAHQPRDALLWAAAVAANNVAGDVLAGRAWLGRVCVKESATVELEHYLNRLDAGLPGIAHHENPEFLDRMALLRSDLPALAMTVPSAVRMVALAVRISVTAALLVSLHPALLLLAVVALPTLVTSGRAHDRVRRATEGIIEQSVRQGDHLFGLLTQPETSKELRVFGTAAEIARRDESLWAAVTARLTRARLAAAAWNAAGSLVFGLGYIGAVSYVGLRVARGQASIGDLALVIALAGQVRDQVSESSWAVSQVQSTRQAVERLGWLLDYQQGVTAVSSTATPVPDTLTRGLECRDVTFRYPGTEHDVLHGVDLLVPAGTSLAIVGENGAGKSTLVKLICRLYEPTTGGIYADGVDISRFDIEEWRTTLTAAFQDMARFELLVRETVGIGDLPRLDRPEAVDDALHRAGAGALPASIDGGLDAQLGRGWPGGTEISGGQWQKLGLGRSMMRRHPLVLVLDEPTSALDPQSEHDLFQRHATAAHDAGRRTGAITLLVSHRFSTVTMADQIGVIDGGRLSELGTHEELMTLGGTYAELYSIQARAYR